MLTPEQQFQRDNVLARIDSELFWRVDADQPHRNPSFYTGALDPSVYLTRPYAPLPQRLTAFIAYANAVPAAAAQIRANLKTPMPKTRSEEHTSELQSLMRNSYAVFCLKKKKNNKTKKTTQNLSKTL